VRHKNHQEGGPRQGPGPANQYFPQGQVPEYHQKSHPILTGDRGDLDQGQVGMLGVGQSGQGKGQETGVVLEVIEGHPQGRGPDPRQPPSLV
jgi:hypothetical protein